MKTKKLLAWALSCAMAIGSASIPIQAGAAGEISEVPSEPSEITLESTSFEADASAAVDLLDIDLTADEILIGTAEELRELAAVVNSGSNLSQKTVKLTADIDLNNEEWTPIGTSRNAFYGNFDGQGHKISNLYINKPDGDYLGLFGYTLNGTIQNFTLENVNITGRYRVGSVAGVPYTSEYKDIIVARNIQIDAITYVGGAFGYNSYGAITNVDVLGSEGSYISARSNTPKLHTLHTPADL